MRLLLTITLCCAASLGHAASLFTFDPPAGPHRVGLRVVEQYDYSRGYLGDFDVVTGQPVKGEKARPVQTLVWYPAQAAGQAVTYNDYARLSASEEKFGRSEADIDAASASFLQTSRSQNGPAQLKEETARRMWAVRDAKPEGGKFPVVIYAPSFSAGAAENADLCEYLASHGYVVIASPSMGAHTRSMTDDQQGIDAQAADIAFLVAYARSLPQADLAQLAVAGYSWGGISNVFAAARDRRIKALVALDGSVRYFPELVRDAKLSPAQVAVPLLYLAQRPRSLEDVARRGKPVTSFINEMKYADVYLVTLPAMEHFAFASEALRFSPDRRFNDYTRAEVNQAHGWMARYVLQFLDAYLKGQPAGKTFLNNTAQQNGVPAHLLTVEAHRAEGAPPTLETLAAEAAKSGFATLPAIYAGLRKRDAAFELPEGQINAWGYKLMANGDSASAIEVLKLAVALHPDSFNAYDSLAEAYENSRQPELAIDNYRLSLKFNPNNDHGTARLKALGAPL